MLARKKTVYVGADIITLSDACPRAEAVCVADGRIDCLGSREDVLEYARPGGCEIVDLRRRHAATRALSTRTAICPRSAAASIRCTAALRSVPSPPCSRPCATRPPQAMTNG